MVPSIKPAIIKESFNQKKSEQNQRQNLIVDIAVNRCLFRTVELKLFCFNKTPKWKYFSQNSLIASLE
jgi:hypothetical protein